MTPRRYHNRRKPDFSCSGFVGEFERAADSTTTKAGTMTVTIRPVHATSRDRTVGGCIINSRAKRLEPTMLN